MKGDPCLAITASILPMKGNGPTTTDNKWAVCKRTESEKERRLRRERGLAPMLLYV